MMLVAEVVVTAVCSTVASLLVSPILLSMIVLLRGWYNGFGSWTSLRSAIYVGRVWHSRFLPVGHAFTYPLFMYLLDLNDEVEEMGLFTRLMWPLSMIVNFSDADHLKNGEGLVNGEDNRLSYRVCRLVAERTKQQVIPSVETHRVWILTHLSYFGYCFNPVSFYFIQNKETLQTDVVVGEVSNTPWIEMHCYVLHEKSTDSVVVSPSESDSGKGTGDVERHKLNFLFPKTFHVSPFMEMQYKYDWRFSNIADGLKSADSIRIINAMRTIAEDKLAFQARMCADRRSIHPFQSAWQMTCFPVFCVFIQIWIHYEAFWLFYKGVDFQPHPQGFETTVSRLIGNIMTPFYTLQEMINESRSKSKVK